MGLYIMILFFGCLLVYRGFQLQKRLRRITDMPRSKLASAPQGLVEVEGFAFPKTPESAVKLPDGRPAVLHRLELQKFEMSKGYVIQRLKKWVTLHTQTDAPPFYVLDPTGAATVFADKADFEIDNVHTHYGPLIFGKRRQALLNSLPPTVRSKCSGLIVLRYRLREYTITAGSPLLVSGDFRTEQAETAQLAGLANFRDQVINKKLGKLKNATAQLDTNGDGKVSRKESREGYSEMAQASLLYGDAAVEEVPVFGAFRHSSNHNLLIADLHEKDITAKMHLSRNLNIVFGCLIVAVMTSAIIALPAQERASRQRRSAEKAQKARAETDRLAKLLSGREKRELQAAKAIEDSTAKKRLEIAIHEQETRNQNSLNQKKREQEESNTEHQPTIARYHAHCYHGDAMECVYLIESAKALGLSDQYVAGYRAKACQLGEAKYCDRVPSSK